MKTGRKYLFCAALLFAWASSFSQDTSTDSLVLLLRKTKHDTSKCNILLQLAETAPDGVWEKYNEELKTLAEKNAATASAKQKKFYLMHLAAAINNMGFSSESKGNIDKALEHYEKSLAIRTAIDDKAGIAASLISIGVIFKDKGEYFKALEYYEKGKKIYEDFRGANGEVLNKKGLADCTNNMGTIYEQLGDISRALLHYKKSMSVYETVQMADGKTGDKKGVAACLGNIAAVYKNQGNIALSLEYNNMSLKIREEMGDKHGVANILHNLGFIYKDQGDTAKALEYYYKALKINQEIGAKSAVAGIYNNLGVLYKNNGNLPLAIQFYNQSLAMREEMGDKQGIAESLNNIAKVHQKKGDLAQAIEYNFKSLKMRQEIADKKAIANSYVNLADCYFDQKNYSLAVSFGEKSMRICKEIAFPERIAGAAWMLKRAYEARGDFKTSLQNYELYIKMRDSASNEQTKKATIKNQLKYEYEKRAAADSVKNAEEQKVKDAKLSAQNAQIKQEKFQRYSLAVGLLLVLCGLAFVINRFRVTNRQKKIIEEQKIKVDDAFEKLAEKNKEVLDSIYYARRIQRALITNEKYILKKLNSLRRN